MTEPDFAPARGGCACGEATFVVERAPLYVHCCHCTRCQRETGGPFAHHAVVAWCDMRMETGQVEFVAVPSDSGTRHWVARCPSCRTALWNEWGSRKAVTRYVRVGVFDEPARFPPQAHIFMRSRQPWVQTGDVPGFDRYYPAQHWPESSRQRWLQAKQLRARPSDDAGGKPAATSARSPRASPGHRK